VFAREGPLAQEDTNVSERDWKADLKRVFETQQSNKVAEEMRAKETDEKVARLVEAVVVPALEEVRAELQKYGKVFEIHYNRGGASFTLKNHDRVFRYSIDGREGGLNSVSMVNGIRSEGSIRVRAGGDPLTSLTREDVIEDVVQWFQINSRYLL
jgi:hypothetical protein